MILAKEEFINEDKSILYDDQSARIKIYQEDLKYDWIISSKNFNSGCVRSLAQVSGLSVPEIVIDAKYKKPYAFFDTKFIPSMALPKAKYIEVLQHFFLQCVDVIRDGVVKYYNGFYSDSNRIFDMLEPGKVNIQRMRAALNDSNANVLKTFLPRDKNCLLEVPKYNRTETSTGRTKIVSGPRYMTLPKEVRHILVPKRDKLLYVDYSSIEPRVLAQEADIVPQSDIYTQFVKMLGVDLSRDVAKAIFNPIVYGASVETVAILAGMQKNTAANIVAKTKSIFKIDDYSDMKDDSTIKNKFGRVCKFESEDNASAALCASYYAQSTAADAALYGYIELLSSAKNSAPIAIIHDAIIIDASNDDIEPLTAMATNGVKIPGYKFNFPLKVSVIE